MLEKKISESIFKINKNLHAKHCSLNLCQLIGQKSVFKNCNTDLFVEDNRPLLKLNINNFNTQCTLSLCSEYLNSNKG